MFYWRCNNGVPDCASPLPGNMCLFLVPSGFSFPAHEWMRRQREDVVDIHFLLTGFYFDLEISNILVGWMCRPWATAIWIFQQVHEEAFWILDVGFQMWFSFSFFLSTSFSRCDDNWFLCGAFVSALLPPPPVFPLSLLLFSRFSALHLLHTHFCFSAALLVMDVASVGFPFFISTMFPSPFLSSSLPCLPFHPLVRLFACSECADFQQWRSRRAQIELQDG